MEMICIFDRAFSQMKKTILVVTLESSPDFKNKRSLLAHLSLAWEAQGNVVKVLQGTNQPPKADIAISHIDLTNVPDEYSVLLEKYPSTINIKVTSTSKALISQNLLGKSDSYEGEVIVKTANNYGGVPELIHRSESGLVQNTMMSGRPWKRVEYLDTNDYPRFNSINEVPQGVWQNNKLIVEKFLPEKDAYGNFYLRYWIFLGDKEISVLHKSQKAIVKDTDHNSRIITEVPDELRIVRKEMGIDFGRIDYGIVNGKPVVYDINSTPACGENQIKLIGSKLAELAEGIKLYI
jgi:hypothetical protein